MIDLNLLGDLPFANLPSAPAAPPPKPQPKLREFGDATATRQAIYDNVLTAATTMPPLSNQRHTLRLQEPQYIDPPDYSLADQKGAILAGRSIGRRLRGTWELLDNETGQVLDSKKSVVATVPYLSQRGTFIHNGVEYSLRNQQRLRPGSYTREREDGTIENHVNVLPGKGVSHRYFLDPAKGVFFMRVQQAKIPLMPLVKAMGASPQQLREAWGPEIYAANTTADEAAGFTKLKEKFLRPGEHDEHARERLVQRFAEMELDPAVTQRTLGRPHQGVTLDAVLDITKKLLGVSKGTAEVDDRDALPYQQFFGPEDLLAERIAKDHGRVRQGLLWRHSFRGNLQGFPSSALQPQINAALLSSGLGQPLEAINPAEFLDKQHSITRMGSGGIPSMDSVPDSARAVQPTHLGFIDSWRTPESERAGIDLYMASNSRKGNDGQVYASFQDARTGQPVWRSPQDIADAHIAFPSAMQPDAAGRLPATVRALHNGKFEHVPRQSVDLVLPGFESSFSPLGNLVPFKSNVKGQRVAMAGRMLTQALPLVEPEAPLVQSAVPGTGGRQSYVEQLGERMGALFAKEPARVVSVEPGKIVLEGPNGRVEHELMDNFPANRKTFSHQTPVVRPGDVVRPGQLLARSNYTDQHGVTALGKNLRTAYIPWGGRNFEDAIVISEGTAKKLTSEHMYQHDLAQDDKTRTGKRDYVSLFPGRFDRRTLDRFEQNGMIKPGTTVNYGDPLILAARQRDTAENKVHKKGQASFADATITWDHHDPGIVVDTVQGKDGPVVTVKATSPMRVGDKMSNFYGGKGVVGGIIPDAQMPHDADGTPYEVLLNPLGVITRGNPSQIYETMLGKLAAKQGQPIKVEDWQPGRDMAAWTANELRKAGVSDTEDIIDPNTGRKIRGIATGQQYFLKLHHTSESKLQARDSGAYTADETPAKGGESGSKRVSLLDCNALVSHGAVATLRDAGAIRGQQADDYWLQYMQGHTPGPPKVPMVYEKFLNHLRAAGINVARQGSRVNIMAMTDRDVDQLAGNRELQNADTVRWDGTLKPIPGGLFDKVLTGGHGGGNWSKITLAEPMPSPVMEEPIRRVLGLTQKDFEAVLSGQKPLGASGTGPAAIVNALDHIDLDRAIDSAEAQRRGSSRTERDEAIRRLGYLKSAKRLGLHPRDWVMRTVPVLPPAFRPVSVMSGNNLPLVSDANYLYHELFEANRNLTTMQKQLGDEGVGPERLALYHSFKAVTGLGDPITKKTQEKGVQGVLQQVFGSGGPKTGTMQRKLLSTTVDTVGRSVITGNPELDMDTVGLPEDKAFDVYTKFVARELRRQGMPLTQALREIKDRTPLARKVLTDEMERRPVMINRAPVLHKFGILAFRPVLVKGSALQMPPLVFKGMGADLDGDAVQFHVPASHEAVEEAYARLLPSRSLLSPADFKTPVHQPVNEYLGGLFHATSQVGKHPKRIYRTAADAISAYRRGELSAEDQVQILQS